MCTRCGPGERCKIRLPRRPGTGSSRAERPVRPSDRPSDPVRTGPIRVGRAPSRAPLCRVMCPPDAGRGIGVKFGVPGGPGTGSFRAELCGALPGLGRPGQSSVERCPGWGRPGQSSVERCPGWVVPGRALWSAARVGARPTRIGPVRTGSGPGRPGAGFRPALIRPGSLRPWIRSTVTMSLRPAMTVTRPTRTRPV